MSKEQTPDKKFSLAWDSGKPWIKYDHSLFLSVHYEGGNGITSKKAFELVDEIINLYNSQEYASLQNAELQIKQRELLDVLQEAALQIDYLHRKFKPTGSGKNVIARIESLIEKYTDKK